MALILDKLHIGVTSIDSSGNTLTTGYTNLNYTDEYGNVHDNPYIVIDNVIIDKLNSSVNINVNIYKNSDTRSNLLEPIKSELHIISYNVNLYNKYFSIDNMINNNVFTASYKYIKDELYPNWKSDE